jgi:hypothetical protein
VIKNKINIQDLNKKVKIRNKKLKNHLDQNHKIIKINKYKIKYKSQNTIDQQEHHRKL